MRKDIRPYYVKKAYLKFRGWYTNHFVKPSFDYLGDHHTFMKPWHIHVSGPNITMGKCATVIAEPDQPVRIGVWGREPDEGKIKIGDYVLISPGCRISAGAGITIGNSVMIANGVYIADSDWHGVYDRTKRSDQDTPIVIKDNAWIGDHATVLKGVTIGQNSIVGACAVVTRDVPDNVVVAGNPAKIVKHLDAEKGFETRADFFKDPVALEKWYDGIDYMVLKDNSLFNWLRARLWPTTKD
jgi:acetyltransferase-like isoleucine patch superfamily enzyme